MKKIRIILLIVSMIFLLFLTGCSNDEKNTEIETNSEIENIEKSSDEDEEKILTTNKSDAKEKIADIEESFPDIDIDVDIDIEKINEAIETIDTSLLVDIDTQSDEYIMDKLGNILKYEVSDLEYEGYENEVYNLSYFSEEDWEDVAVYFHMILYGTTDFIAGQYHEDMGEIGGALKGTLFGLTTVVEIRYEESIDESNIVIFCRPYSW